MKKKVIVGFAVTTALLSVAAGRHRASAPPATLALNASRSFAVTDIPLLEKAFPFRRVLDSIVAGSATTSEQLIRQMFDTQNPRPGMADATAPHCDDFLVDGMPTFNGFPRRCPTPEGKLAAVPFAPDQYEPLALINRFDMAPADGGNCGQYRIIYEGTVPTPGHVDVILEAVLPNPHRELGLAGCRPVAQFWADLSAVDSLEERRVRLERFFFDGIDGFEGVLRADHYTLASGGGIRTRHTTVVTIPTPAARTYQFRTERQCPPSGACVLRLVPDVLENFPFGPMFDASIDTPVARAFRENFIAQIPTLAINDLNLMRMKVDRQFLVGESNPLDATRAFDYIAPFLGSQSTDEGKAFRARIDAELKRIGSDLTPENIVARAQTQTCSGCHFVPQSIGGGLIFPGAFDIAQVTQFDRLPGDGGPNSRWGISAAMEKVFLPNRVRILREFLQSGQPPEHSN